MDPGSGIEWKRTVDSFPATPGRFLFILSAVYKVDYEYKYYSSLLRSGYILDYY